MTNEYSPSTVTELIFIDGSLQDTAVIAAGVKPGAAVFILDSLQDGLAQIAAISARYQDLAAIHLASHGSAGSLQLGNATVDRQALAEQRDLLVQIGQSLSTSGDLLLYGCDVAAGDIGQSFVDDMARWTGADVAASTDLTGAAFLGGDWNLEYHFGGIEATSLSVEGYAAVLESPDVAGFASTIFGTVLNPSLPLTGSVTGAVGGASDQDWYQVALTAGAQYLFLESKTAGSPLDSYFRLYSAASVLLGQDDDAGGDRNSRLVYTATTTGTHYASAGGYGSSTGDYVLRVLRVDSSSTSGHNSISGTSNNDWLSGGLGNDSLYGGIGDDSLSGDEGNDSLAGSNGNDTLDGGLGADTMNGGDQDDTYVVDDVSDLALESFDDALGGLDTVIASASHTLGYGIENLTLSLLVNSSAALTATGNGKNNAITGNYGDNTIDGGTGVDTLEGGYGNDVFIVDTSTDTITDVSGLDRVESSVDFYLFNTTSIENLTLTGTAAYGSGNDLDNSIIGNASNNYLFGATGNDTLQGGAGTDTLESGEGIDSLIGGSGDDAYYVDVAGDVVVELANEGNDIVYSYALSYEISNPNIENLTLYGFDYTNSGTAYTGIGNAGANLMRAYDAPNWLEGRDSNDTIYAGGGNDSLYGGNGADALFGEAGNDLLEGGAGIDAMAGGIGDDTYVMDTLSDVISESAGEGNDTIQIGQSFNLGTVSNIENLTLTGTGNFNATGNAQNNSLRGNSGNNLLDGSTGADTMDGGAGNDTYTVDDYSDVTTESDSVGGGMDTVNASVDHSIGSGIEVLNLLGTAYYGSGNALANTITGNASENYLQGLDGNDTLTGLAGDDYLDGGTGTDSMVGGTGNDTYYVDNLNDLVVELASEGIDWIYAYLDYSLQANLENLYLLSGNYGYGNDVGNIMYGNSGANSLYAFGGDDSLLGFGGNDSLYGYDGNDTLDGGSGVDFLWGGLGDDRYFVDNSSDTTYEYDTTASGGIDTVYASVARTLDNGLENLLLTGSATIGGSGNAAANFLQGNFGANTLFGLAGNDTLDGGNDTTGDLLYGGQDNDTYVVGTGDTVSESANEGTDLVQSGISWVLAANVENLALTGTGHINGTGNTLANAITGNSGNNVLNGGDGNDTLDGATGVDNLQGGNGDDLLVVDSTTDTVDGGAGIDTVQSTVSFSLGGALVTSIENLALSGSAANATGNAGNNALTGNSANNTLDGAGGSDTLTGGLGDDTYVVDVSSDVVVELALGGTDTVQSSASSYTLSGEVESLVLTGSANISGSGNSGNNTITGNSGNNSLSGGAGADTMAGGAGDDTYDVDNAGDTVTEGTNGGTDTVRSSVSYTLGANAEQLVLTGSDALTATGNNQANTLIGNDGDNLFITGGGNDSIDGGLGLLDKVRLSGNQADWFAPVVSGPQATLTHKTTGQQVTILRAERLQYDDADNVVLELGLNISDPAGGASSVLNGGAGSDTLNGLGGNDTLNGLAGDDFLIGGSGFDSMVGGSGNDIFDVDSFNNGSLSNSDIVVEDADPLVGGIDTVISSVSININNAAIVGVEYLTLTASAAIGGGNDADNRIIGNAVANSLTGLLGNDTLFGGVGNDTLAGGGGRDSLSGGADQDNLSGDDGDDTLDGGAGNDTMAGGLGDDTYYVDSASDTVTEALNAGTDTMISSVNNFGLTNNVENLILTGGAFYGYGNALANRITGTDNANQLYGNGGADTLVGAGGDDLYYVVPGQLVVELADAGQDSVYLLTGGSYTLADNVENLQEDDSSVGGVLTGNSLANSITGNSSANTIDGAAGADTLEGYDGNDTYLVDNAGDIVVESGSDTADAVWSSISYDLGASLENLRLLGSAAINGAGNVSANALTGNSGSNLLSGLAGNDTIDGASGDDLLAGGIGNDLLIGGDGQDTALYDLEVSNYVLGVNANGVVTVRALSGSEGTDNLVGVERADFNGRVINVGSANQFGELRTGTAFSAGYSTTPAVAALKGGGQVITWEQNNQVSLQRYDALGAAIGGVSQVIQYGSDSDIAALADGGFAIVFYGYEPGTDGYGIRVKRFDAAGTQTASVYLSNDNWDPSITALAGGGYAVSWSAYSNGNDVKARTYSSTDSAGSTVVLSGPTGDQYYSNITGTSDGGFIATWYDNGEIRERHFDAMGAPALVGGNPAPEVTVSTSYGYQPVVIALTDGSHVTLWQGFDGYWDGVIGQRFDAAGVKVGDTFAVNTFTQEGQVMPSAAALANGGFVVVWESDNQDGSDSGIFGQRFSADGARLGDEFQVNATTLYGQHAPDVAAFGNGFVVTWRSEGQDGGVFSQRFDGDGHLIGGLAVTGTEENDSLDASDAVQSVIMNGAGGNDDLSGGSAADTLAGGAGNDTLHGGSGDLLQGGADNDTYLVESLNDTISEAEDDGTDEVRTHLADYQLGESAIERLVLLGNGNSNGTGNQYDNVLVGNFGANVLSGEGGDDRLEGSFGSDTASFSNVLAEYVFGVDLGGNVTVRHTVVGGDGTDTLDAIQFARFTNPDPAYHIALGTLSSVDTAQRASDDSFGYQAREIVALPDGGALVAWHDYDGQIGQYQVFAQRLDSDGHVSGARMVLGTTPDTGSLTSLSLTPFEGAYVALWSLWYDSDPDINVDAYRGVSVARFLSSDLEPLGTDPFEIAPPSTSYPSPGPSVVALDSGGVGIYFLGGYNGSFNPLNVQQYDATGGPVSIQALNIGAGNNLDALSDGRILRTDFNSNVTPQGNTEYWFSLQRFSSAGATIGTAIQLTDKSANSYGLSDLQAVKLTNGNVAVLFERFNGTDTDIAGQVFDTFWQPLSATQLNFTGNTAFEQSQGTIAALPTGGFVVAWEDSTATRRDVYMRVYDANGVPTTTSPQLAHANTTGSQTNPSLVVHDDGSFDVFYGQDNGYLYGQSYDADGHRMGGLDLTGGPGADTLLAIDALQSVNIKGQAGNDTLAGGAANDTLDGGSGNDYLDGGAGADLLAGGANNDTYVYDGTADTFVEQEGQGTDTVLASASYTLPSTSIENVTLMGHVSDPALDADLAVTGNSRANILIGNAGDNSIDGAGGNDSMIGGDGDDVYYVDATGDTVTEGTGPDSGTDRIISSVSIGAAGLFVNVEILELSGTSALYGGGNDLDNILIGNSGANTLEGRGGNDIYVIDATDTVNEAGNSGNDTIRIDASYTLTQVAVENLELLGTANWSGTGNGINNRITGNAGANLLSGSGGNDTLVGGGGADTLAGGLGDDEMTVDSASDVVQESAGQGVDTVVAWVDYALPTGTNGQVENLILAGAANLQGTGNALDNILTGNSGNNLLDGGAGNDTMVGGDGNDTYDVDNAGDGVTETIADDTTTNGIVEGGLDTIRSLVTIGALASNVENLVLLGTASINGLGNALANLLTGNNRDINSDSNTGNNLLNGMEGADTMAGGSGDDTYVVDNVGDQVIELGNQGIDSVETNLAEYTLSDNVERLVLTGTTALRATGNNLANVIEGNTLNNRIDGGAGADTMSGGAGDDFYSVESVGDLVVEIAGEGTDTVFSTLASYLLPRNVEHLTLLGTANINGIGNYLSNIIQGNSGNNEIDGGQFVDVLIGAGGNDTYYVDSGDDLVVEYAGGGNDSIFSTVTYVLPEEVENLNLNLSLTSPLATDINATGNVLANILTGNGGSNVLRGLDGNDTLVGGAGNDTLDGGTGADAMTGNAGNDTYQVDNIGDVIVEALDEGADLVQSSLSYTLGINVENLQLLGTANLLGTGNSLANQLIGNDGNNLLTSLGGDDLLQGGRGIDTMVGGLGNDIYYVDNSADVVTESTNQGTDIVYVSSPGTGVNQQPLNGYVLPANVENVIYFDLYLLFVVGNGLNNYFTGNDGDNRLDGAGGADTMEGGKGNDTYVVENLGDLVIESGSEGTDIVEASVNYTLSENVENLILTGSAQEGKGNSGNNLLAGNSANNKLDGGSGNDTMAGGAGNDTYVVDAEGDVVNETMAGSSGFDVIMASVDLTLPDAIEELELLGLNNLTGKGNSQNNKIVSNNGNNVIDGGGGNNTVDYKTANAGVNVDLATGLSSGGGGVDFLMHIQNANGSNQGDMLGGSDGDNVLDGKAGTDTMVGGYGSDTYYVDDLLDQVVEVNNDAAPGAPGGLDLNVNLDTVVASVLNYTLGAYIENLVQAGVSDAIGNGNELQNNLTGNDGNNLLQGLGAADTLNGGLGHDTLDGGTGADSMVGGDGDDTYFVDNAGDVVVETNADVLAGGNDTVFSTIAYVLGANVEGLRYLVDTAINLTGNALNNTLYASLGNNVMDGGAGNDTASYRYAVAAITASLAIAGLQATGSSGSDSFVSIENLTGGEFNDTLTGDANANRLDGLGGNDTLNGGAGADTMAGGDGNDTYQIDAAGDVVVETNPDLTTGGRDIVVSLLASYTLGSNVEDLVLGTGAITAIGNVLGNLLTGNAGSINYLSGGAGADTMLGGDGADTYYVDNVGDVVTEINAVALTGGIDTVVSSITSYALGINVENLILSGSAISGTGNALNNYLEGNALANTLNGSAGVDTMVGGDGNDSFYVDTAGDAVIENNAVLLTGGRDTVFSSIASYSLTANVEDLTLTGSATTGIGNNLANLIVGNSASVNYLNGGSGADTMIGGDGNDTYYVDSVGDLATETNAVLGTGGLDTVVSTLASYTLSANIEHLILGTGGVTGYGNALNNYIAGNSAANNYLVGGAGADTMVGGDGNDTYYVDNTGDGCVETNANQTTGGRDTVVSTLASYSLGANVEDLILGTGGVTAFGNSLNNFLQGNSGVNNYLNGGAGADTMVGGDGNDTYYADNAGDGCVESNANVVTGGRDSVVVSNLASYALGANIEDLILGAGGVTGFGNSLNNFLQGNGEAVNYLNGGLGADTMVGGDGNDTYYVDNVGDGVVETNSNILTGGRDTVSTSLASYSIGLNVEDLILTGSAVTGIGNALNNYMAGSSAAINYLDGGLGADTMVGGDGNDTYYVDNVGDGVVETNAVLATGGRDTVSSTITYALGQNVEDLLLSGTLAINGSGNTLNNYVAGNGGANTLAGFDGNDTLSGLGGNDTLVGGNGTDNLTGGLGADVFDFNSIFESQTGSVRDVITDFSSAQIDRIDLAGIDANTLLANDQAFSYIGSAAFSAAGQMRLAGNILSGDVDGNGVADFELQLLGVASLTGADFIL